MKNNRLRLICALLALPAAASTVRIVQTNSAGDNVHIIDPATNKVVGIIDGIEVNHGVSAAPDGSRYYISNEAESTLDIVDTKSLKVGKKIPLSGHPNNIDISKDGHRLAVMDATGPVRTIMPGGEPNHFLARRRGASTIEDVRRLRFLVLLPDVAAHRRLGTRGLELGDLLLPHFELGGFVRLSEAQHPLLQILLERGD